jgi:hypothetical protein
MKKKRVALIGNMNNNMFALTRYLIDNGYDAHLFYRETSPHFNPKADTFSLDYLSFCYEVNWFQFSTRIEAIPHIKKQLIGYNFFIGQGDEAAYAVMAGIKFDVYYPYGSDFYKYAWLPQNYSLLKILYGKVRRSTPIKESLIGSNAKFIRKAIVESKFVLFDKTNDEIERKLADLNIQGKLMNIPMPFLYLLAYDKDINWDVHWKNEIKKLREQNEFLILYHGRQEWITAKKSKLNPYTNKNTDFLIEGYAKFCKLRSNNKTALIMIEYGNDVAYSKRLIDDLNISKNVIWLPVMYRKDLMYLISQVDVCCGEFNQSYLTFGTIIESMSMAKPVIHHRDDSLYSEAYTELYPLYNARTPDEITIQIDCAFSNPNGRVQMGLDAKKWVKKYFIDKPLKTLLELIEN